MAYKQMNPVKALVSEVCAFYSEKEEMFFKPQSIEEIESMALWKIDLRRKVSECDYSQEYLLKLMNEYKTLPGDKLRDWLYE